MKKLICIFVVLLSIFGFFFTTDSSEKELKITMVLWRGKTNAEKGLQEGLNELGYSTQYTIKDAEQNRTD